jgi:predicted nucleic acid-binding protein
MTSKHIEKVVVADANVLLSALAQKAASKVFLYDIEIITTSHTIEEVKEYLPRFSQKDKVPLMLLRRSMDMLPVKIKQRLFYAESLERAEKLIGSRDPEDVDILALALKTKAPIWTNDNDFKKLGVKVIPTAKLLFLLESAP